jgi:hypothetical protein
MCTISHSQVHKESSDVLPAIPLEMEMILVSSTSQVSDTSNSKFNRYRNSGYLKNSPVNYFHMHNSFNFILHIPSFS